MLNAYPIFRQEILQEVKMGWDYCLRKQENNHQNEGKIARPKVDHIKKH